MVSHYDSQTLRIIVIMSLQTLHPAQTGTRRAARGGAIRHALRRAPDCPAWTREWECFSMFEYDLVCFSMFYYVPVCLLCFSMFQYV